MKRKYQIPRSRVLHLEPQSILADSGSEQPTSVRRLLRVINQDGGFSSEPGVSTAKKAILW